MTLMITLMTVMMTMMMSDEGDRDNQMLPRVAGKRPARSKLPARDFLELHHHHLQTLPFPHPPTTPTLKRNTKGPEEGSLPWRPRKPPWDGPEPLFETPRIALLISTALLMSTTQFSGHPGLWLSIYGRWRNRWDADNMSNDASYSMWAFEHGQWWQCFPAYNEVNQVRARSVYNCAAWWRCSLVTFLPPLCQDGSNAISFTKEVRGGCVITSLSPAPNLMQGTASQDQIERFFVPVGFVWAVEGSSQRPLEQLRVEPPPGSSHEHSASSRSNPNPFISTNN